MLKIGHKVPDFEAKAFYEGEIQTIRLSDHLGKWVLMVFYPADFTFVCPTELEEVAGLYDEFQKAGAEVFSVSTDTVWAHKAWHDTSPAIKKIKFPMLADPTAKICQTFGTYIEEEGVSLRGSFIIDPDGVLRVMEIDDNSIGRSARELLRKLRAAIFVRQNKGEVCPAGWEPGQKTLKPGLDLVGKI